MPSWTLEIDYAVLGEIEPVLSQLFASIGVDSFPRYAEAAETISENAEQLYKGYLLGKPMQNGQTVKSPSKEAAEGVARRAAGQLQWDLMNTVDEAKRIEEGAPAFDMKSVLPTSKKARMSKEGFLYLIIPFRHGNPNATSLQPMPKAIYKIAKQLSYSYQLGTIGSRKSAATGAKVPVFGYQWGDKLQAGLAPKKSPGHKGDIYAGMYRFNGPKQSEFITFRTMSQKSTGWIKKATPGYYPLQQALQVAMNEGKPSLAAAIQEDFAAMLGLVD
jgi:hypothetical protein